MTEPIEADLYINEINALIPRFTGQDVSMARTNEMDDLSSGLARRFLDRIETRTAVIGIIGLGYAGLPLVLACEEAGFSCIGFDIDPVKVQSLSRNKTYIHHISDARIEALNASKRFAATMDFSRIADVDVVVICVPTPLSNHREPDMSFVVATAEAIAPHLKAGQLVSLESTTYPTTSEGLLRSVLESHSKLRADRDIALCFSPEREDPGNLDFGTVTIPKVVGADTQDAGDMACAFYQAVVGEVVRVESMRTAEAVKLTENIFRSVNIALVNELKVIFDSMGIDVFRVIDAAKTKPFGFMPFYPGPGVGGHCIPVDPFYLTWKAREFGLHTRFVELSGEINSAMPQWVVGRLVDTLSDKFKLAINGAKVLVVGLAYKKNVDDIRESPSITLMEILGSRGAAVSFHDPYVPVFPMTRDHDALAGMASAEWTSTGLADFDAAIIATDHDGLDYRLLLDSVPVVIDTRDALRAYAGEYASKIVKA